MITKSTRSKKLLNKAGFGSFDAKKLEILTTHDIDPRVYAKGSPTNMENISKISTNYCQSPTEELTMMSNTIPNHSTLGSSRSYATSPKGGALLPILSGRGSTFKYNTSPMSKNSMIPSLSPNLPLITTARRYDKIIVNMKEDFTSASFLKNLKRLFNKTTHSKISLTKEGVRRKVSSTAAQKILEALAESLLSIQNIKNERTRQSKINIDFQRHISEQYSLVSDLDSSITDILNIVENAIPCLREKRRLDLYMKEMTEVAHQSRNSELILYCLYIQAKVFQARNEIKDAITYFKQYKSMCAAHRVLNNKVLAYKHLGKCYQDLRKHKAALIYYTKFLQMAWFLDSAKYETFAYDCIGKQYYYLGMINKAAAFHYKTMAGKLEPKNSSLRQIGVYKIKLGHDSYQHSYYTGNGLMNIEGAKPIMEDEDEEVPSRDEAIDLPTPPSEEMENNKEEPSKTNVAELEAFLKKKLSKKRIERSLMGVMKAKMMDKKAGYTKKAALPKFNKDNERGHKTEIADEELEEIKEIPVKSKPKALLNVAPAEQIYLSHLSRNRNLKNFSLLASPIAGFDESSDHEFQVTLGLSAAERVKRILEKFRANLRLVKESLEICGVENEPSLLDIDERRIENSRKYL